VKILVTGGAGFIGSNFIRMIANSSIEDYESIIVLDKLTYAGNLNNLSSVMKNSHIRFIKGDICDQDLIRKLILGVDSIINFAAESHVDRSIRSSEVFVHSNINGVQVILDSIRNVNDRIRFLQVSTDEIYGSIDSGSWDEESPPLPNSPYSATKASAELLVRSYVKTYGLDCVITRCSNNYGPFHFPEKLIPLFITNLIEGKKVPIYGSGNNVRDWLHVDDHCRALDLVIKKGLIGNIYNIGGGRELTNLEITKSILELMGKGTEYIKYVGDRQGHDLRYSINWDKIRIELGYQPQINFDDGLRQTVEWYLDNKNWWLPLKKNEP
jgi:dTDP-glucose 4,6-dehydratase